MSNGRYDACSCGIDGGIVSSKRARKQKIHIFASDFACPRWARRRQPNEQASEPGDFDVAKIENMLPARVGSMVLKNTNSYQVPPGISFLLLARHWLVFFENHKIQVGGQFGSAGRNARGRWGEI